MSIQSGKLYTCSRKPGVHKDGNLRQEFVKDGDDAAEGRWHTITFEDTFAVTTETVLCEECYEKYKSIMETWNRDVCEFITQERK